MTVFVQHLGHGLRLHEGKSRSLLDLISNYRRAQYKQSFLTGIEDDSLDAIAIALNWLIANKKPSTLPDVVDIHLERLALAKRRSVIETSKPQILCPNRSRVNFGKIQNEIGRRPILVDIKRRGLYPGRQCRLRFSSWLGAIEPSGVLSDGDRAILGSECRAFLNDIERTPMTRSYKMVVLDAMLQPGRFQLAISLDELTALAMGCHATAVGSCQDQWRIQSCEVCTRCDQLDCHRPDCENTISRGLEAVLGADLLRFDRPCRGMKATRAIRTVAIFPRSDLAAISYRA